MTKELTPKIVDSEGKSYSVGVMDMLVRIYRFMVLNMWEFTVQKAWVADHYTSIALGGAGNMKVAEKFIKELEYVKQLAEKQPITFIQIQYYVHIDKDVYELTGKVEDLSMRTFDKSKMNKFISDTKHQSTNVNLLHNYKRFEILKIEEFNHEYLEVSK